MATASRMETSHTSAATKASLLPAQRRRNVKMESGCQKIPLRNVREMVGYGQYDTLELTFESVCRGIRIIPLI